MASKRLEHLEHRDVLGTVRLQCTGHQRHHQQPEAQAVAIRGQRIIKVGTNEEVRRLARSDYTRVIDLRGRLVLPTGDDLEAACVGYFIPPQRLTTDDYREMLASSL